MKLLRVIKAKTQWKSQDQVIKKIRNNIEKEGYNNWLENFKSGTDYWNHYKVENEKEGTILEILFYEDDYNELENKVSFILYTHNNNKYKKLKNIYTTTIDEAINIKNITEKIKAINPEYSYNDNKNIKQILEKIFNMGDIIVSYKDLNIKISPNKLLHNRIIYNVDVYEHFPFFVNATNKDNKIYLRIGYINDIDEKKIMMKNEYNKNDINKMFDDIKQCFTKSIVSELKQAEREDYLDDYR